MRATAQAPLPPRGERGGAGPRKAALEPVSSRGARVSHELHPPTWVLPAGQKNATDERHTKGSLAIPGTTGRAPPPPGPSSHRELDPRLSPVCTTRWPLPCPHASAWGLLISRTQGWPLGHRQPQARPVPSHTTTPEPQSHGTPTERTRGSERSDRLPGPQCWRVDTLSTPGPPPQPPPGPERQATGAGAALGQSSVLTAGAASRRPQAPPLAPSGA